MTAPALQTDPVPAPSWHRVEFRYRGVETDWFVCCAPCWQLHELRPTRYVDMYGGGVREIVVKAIRPPTGEACQWCEREAV